MEFQTLQYLAPNDLIKLKSPLLYNPLIWIGKECRGKEYLEYPIWRFRSCFNTHNKDLIEHQEKYGTIRSLNLSWNNLITNVGIQNMTQMRSLDLWGIRNENSS